MHRVVGMFEYEERVLVEEQRQGVTAIKESVEREVGKREVGVVMVTGVRGNGKSTVLRLYA